MATMKIRFLTEVRKRRKLDGGVYFGATGITSESKMAICLIREQQRDKVKKNKHYVLHGVKMGPKDEDVYVQFLNEAKVIIVLLRSVVHCVLSKVHNV